MKDACVIYPIPGVYTNNPVDVSVIIPMYNTYRVIQEQITRWPIEHKLKVELIYVDDRCPQKSRLAVSRGWNLRRDKHQQLVKLVLPIRNQGFGGACNLGAYYAVGKYLVFLNADTTVTPNWLEPIIETLADPQVGIVGNLQLKEGGPLHGTIDSAGSEWTWEHMNFFHLGRHIYNGKVLDEPMYPDKAPLDLLKPSEREMVTGCCLAIKKDLFQDIGGFHCHYAVGYWEDSELCASVRERGYKVMFQPESIIYHKLSHSGIGQHGYYLTNKERFFSKWVDSGRIDPLVKSPRNVRPVKIKNILIRRGAANGDVLVAAAIAPAIKKLYPGSTVYFVTKCPKILHGNPYVDHVVTDAEVHKNLYQLRINLDLAYERRPFTNILQAYADEAGVKVSDCELVMGQQTFDQWLPDKYVVVYAGNTAWAGRHWTEAGFQEIARRFQENSMPVVCVGGRGDREVPSTVDLRGKTTFGQLAYVINRAQFFVGIDSMPMHIAQAVRTPGLSFFGCILPETRIVCDTMHGIQSPGVSCLGCHHRKLPPATATTECKIKTSDCEHKLSADDVWERIKELCDLSA